MLQRLRTGLVFAPALFLASAAGIRAQQESEYRQEIQPEFGVSADCSFTKDPDEFLTRAERSRMRLAAETDRVGRYLMDRSALSRTVTLDANTIPRKTFIDQAIFDRMKAAGIEAAPLASDAEYIRRVTLDLTGRIPAVADVESFLANTSPTKRDTLVDSLIGSPEFVDKWTMFFGDLFKNNAQATNVNRQIQGRDAFYLWIKDSVTRNKPYNQMASELIAGAGDSFVQGNTNWAIGGTVPMGPVQDTYDGQAAAVAATFMGINTVDCLLCHDGARHLDGVNLWASAQTRWDLWGLSAYFARTRMVRTPVQQGDVAKYIVSDLNTGVYALNTTTGNRSPRAPVNGVAAVSPRYPFGTPASAIGSGETYRQGLARQVTADLQFSRAAVNYIWEELMVEAFVSPANGFDLARLDPNNPPPPPWELQPANAELLNTLAQWFQQNGYDWRGLIAIIAKSNAYQLSAVYPDTWKSEYVPFYARKFVRRLDAEELYDAIQKATGIVSNFTLQELPPVQWAMQLPDTREPRNNAASAAFLNAFGRGDRDQRLRTSDGSPLQALNMMNNAFVMNRIHQNNQGSTVGRLVAANVSVAEAIRLLFMNTLSRNPTAAETAALTPLFQQQGLARGAESLQWILLNKLDFLFNY